MSQLDWSLCNNLCSDRCFFLQRSQFSFYLLSVCTTKDQVTRLLSLDTLIALIRLWTDLIFFETLKTMFISSHAWSCKVESLKKTVTTLRRADFLLNTEWRHEDIWVFKDKNLEEKASVTASEQWYWQVLSTWVVIILLTLLTLLIEWAGVSMRKSS